MDGFDIMGKKLARAYVETCELCDSMEEPFRSAGITALKEFLFRAIGDDFDWEEFKIRRKKFEAAPHN